MNLKKKPKFHYFSENQRSEDALMYKFFVLSAIGCLQMQLFIGRHRLENCVSFLSFHQLLLCHSGIHRRIKHQATISKQETEGEGESSGRGRKREGRTGYPHKKRGTEAAINNFQHTNQQKHHYLHIYSMPI